MVAPAFEFPTQDFATPSTRFNPASLGTCHPPISVGRRTHLTYSGRTFRAASFRIEVTIRIADCANLPIWNRAADYPWERIASRAQVMAVIRPPCCLRRNFRPSGPTPSQFFPRWWFRARESRIPITPRCPCRVPNCPATVRGRVPCPNAAYRLWTDDHRQVGSRGAIRQLDPIYRECPNHQQQGTQGQGLPWVGRRCPDILRLRHPLAAAALRLPAAAALPLPAAAFQAAGGAENDPTAAARVVRHFRLELPSYAAWEDRASASANSFLW